MEKITKQQIGILGNYFNSGGIESLDSEALSDFVDGLKIIFESQPFDEVVFNNFLAANGATDFKNEILVIKNEYEFQTEIQQSFKQIEREKLKKKFTAIDGEQKNEVGVSDNEITTAFKLNERENLKNKFREIDNEEKMPPAAKVLPLKTFNFRQWAIAASVALIFTIGAIFFINDQKPADQIVKNETLKPKNSFIDFSKSLADNQLKSFRKDLPINKLGEMGFVSKPIHFENYLLQPRIDTLQKIVTYLKKNKADLAKIKGIEKTIDSLNNLNFKYTFTDNKLKLYSYRAVKAEIFQDNDKLSISVQKKDYPFKETKTLKSLK